MTVIKQQYGRQNFELVERESCFKGFFSLERFHFKHQCFKGGWSRVIRREVFVRGTATCVLPYDPVAGTVVLLEQFRVGAVLEENQSPWLIELVAGINDKDELPEEVGRREALEEAGLDLKQMWRICDYLASPGGSTEKIYLYCAQVDSQGIGGVYGLIEEDEDIRVHVVTLEAALTMVELGQINNAAAIIALQWLALNRAKVDKAWLHEPA